MILPQCKFNPVQKLQYAKTIFPYLENIFSLLPKSILCSILMQQTFLYYYHYLLNIV